MKQETFCVAKMCQTWHLLDYHMYRWMKIFPNLLQKHVKNQNLTSMDEEEKKLNESFLCHILIIKRWTIVRKWNVILCKQLINSDGEKKRKKKCRVFFSASEQFKPQCESNEDVNVDVTKKKNHINTKCYYGNLLDISNIHIYFHINLYNWQVFP